MSSVTYTLIASFVLVVFVGLIVYVSYKGAQKAVVPQQSWYLQSTVRSQIGGGVVTAVAFAVGMFVPGLFNNVGHALALVGLILLVIVLSIGAIKTPTNPTN